MTPDTVGSLRGSIKSFAQVALLALASGTLIVLQDALIAYWFAASEVVDAYQLAISFPTTALNVFAGGTLLATLVPRLIQLEAAGRTREAAMLVHQVRRWMGGLLAAICLVWAVAFPLVAPAVAREFSPAALELAIRLAWLHLPVLVLSGLASIEVAVQCSRQRFWLLSTMPAFVPAGAAAGVVALAGRLGIVAASLGSLVGALVFFVAARRTTSRLIGRALNGEPRAGLAPLIGGYAASASSAALLGGILMSDIWVASTLPAGRTATFGYATRPVVLSLAFATTVVGNVLLPTFARLVAEHRYRLLRTQFLLWAAVMALAATPLVAVVFVYAGEVVALVYERGTFGPSDTENVAAVQRVYVLQVPWFLVAMLGWRLLNSLERHAVLLGITLIAFAVNLAIDLWWAPVSGLVGIAWGTNLAFAALALLITLYVLVALPRERA
jgi:putative peptidoglycan lipid II flippase